jgi:hypothetical protein
MLILSSLLDSMESGIELILNMSLLYSELLDIHWAIGTEHRSS